jgi:hypothetical protein
MFFRGITLRRDGFAARLDRSLFPIHLQSDPPVLLQSDGSESPLRPRSKSLAKVQLISAFTGRAQV